MELTTEQIQKVEHYLNVNGIDYIDLRMEVLDHIISDIEATIKEENSEFDAAFHKVASKWNKQLEQVSSFYFGVGFSAPKIVIEKVKKMYAKYFVFFILSYFAPFLLLTELDFAIQNPSENKLYILLQGVVVFSFVAFLYLFKNRNYKIKTTSGFILKTLGLNLFMGFIIIFIKVFDTPKELNGIYMGLITSCIFSTYVYFHFYKKHKSAIKKCKIS